MNKKRYGIPALLLGVALLGGGTAAYAFGPSGPGAMDMEAFAGFSSDEQAAIQKAADIRAAAEEEARAVLEAAGITDEEMHDAMQSFHEDKRAELDEALDDNDYDAYIALVANTPMADQLTQDVFSKLVEIRALEEAGDHDEARALREDLGLKGFGGHRGERPDGPRPAQASN